jgi:hypothetical protein
VFATIDRRTQLANVSPVTIVQRASGPARGGDRESLRATVPSRRMAAPYRDGEQHPPREPALRVSWTYVAVGVAVAAGLWLLSPSSGCAVLCALPFPLAVLALIVSWRRGVERRQRALGWVVALCFVVVTAGVMQIEAARADRREAQVITEAKRFYVARGRLPTEAELAAIVGPLERGAVRNEIQYVPDRAGNKAMVIRVLLAPFGRRITRLPEGRTNYLD